MIFNAAVRVVILEVMMNNRITELRLERHLLPGVRRATSQSEVDRLDSVALNMLQVPRLVHQSVVFLIRTKERNSFQNLNRKGINKTRLYVKS